MSHASRLQDYLCDVSTCLGVGLAANSSEVQRGAGDRTEDGVGIRSLRDVSLLHGGGVNSPKHSPRRNLDSLSQRLISTRVSVIRRKEPWDRAVVRQDAHRTGKRPQQPAGRPIQSRPDHPGPATLPLRRCLQRPFRSVRSASAIADRSSGRRCQPAWQPQESWSLRSHLQ